MTQPKATRPGGPKASNAKSVSGPAPSGGPHKTPAMSRLSGVVWAIAIAGVCAAAYSTSFQGVFVFDDTAGILNNPDLMHLDQPGRLFHYVFGAGFGSVWTGRPLVNATFAANYFFSQGRPYSYHLVNLAIHILAAITLFGIIRHTLTMPRLAGKFASAANWLAFVAAALWAVHPIQVTAVTYIWQRAESLMGLWFLLTLYCVIRGATSQSRGVVAASASTAGASSAERQASAGARWWYALAVICCLLGMGCKQVMVTCPFVVLVYDRIFLSGSWRALFRRRALVYALLLATAAVPVVTYLVAKKDPSAGFGARDISAAGYLAAQGGVILHYLGACFWPAGLCVDYSWPYARTLLTILAPGAVILALLALTVWALYRYPAAGFLGVWFFVILAPTSSFMPIVDLAFDHRMYLSLAAVTALVVIGGYAAARWAMARRPLGAGAVRGAAAAGAAGVGAAIFSLGLATYERNGIFWSDVDFWTDSADKRPNNDRAIFNLGNALLRDRKYAAAEARYRQALAIKPDSPGVHVEEWVALTQLGQSLSEQGKLEPAVEAYLKALEVKGDFAPAHFRLAKTYYKMKRPDLALPHMQAPIKEHGDNFEGRMALADALAEAGRYDEALAQYNEALKLQDSPAAHANLGVALLKVNRASEAADHLRRAIQLDPDVPASHCYLGAALDKTGRTSEAIWEFRRTIQLKDDYFDALNNLAWILATCDKAELRDGRSAVELAQKACQAKAFADPDALDTLAAAFAETGQFDNAVGAVTDALAIARKTDDKARQAVFQQHLELYQARKPLRQPATTQPR